MNYQLLNLFLKKLIKNIKSHKLIKRRSFISIYCTQCVSRIFLNIQLALKYFPPLSQHHNAIRNFAKWGTI